MTPDAGTDAGDTEGGRPRGPRASDADRERFAEELHEHFAEGRLSHRGAPAPPRPRLRSPDARRPVRVDERPASSGPAAVPTIRARTPVGRPQTRLVALRLNRMPHIWARWSIHWGHQRKEVVQFMSSQRLGTLEVAGR